MKILDVIDKAARGKVAISMGYVGLAATNTATNNMLLLMRVSTTGNSACGCWRTVVLPWPACGSGSVKSCRRKSFPG